MTTTTLTLKRPKWFYANFLLLGLIAISVSVVLIWLNTATLEESVTGVGQFLPDGQLRQVMAPETGLVSQVYVTENQEVQAGQVLMSLDPEMGQVQEGAVNQQLGLLQQEVSSLESAMSGQSNSSWARALAVSRESALMDANMQIEKTQHLYQEALAKQKQLTELLQSRQQMVAQYRSLAEQGGLAQRELATYEQELINIKGQLEQSKQAVKASQVEYQQAKVRPTQVEANYQRDLLSRINDTQQRIASVSGEAAKVKVMVKHTLIFSPIDGVIHQQLVHGAGEVIETGKPVFVIVPKNAQLVAEVKVTNKDVAYIKKGQRVSLKMDAAPYQQFGMLYGKITSISPSTVYDKEGNPFFMVKISPEKTTLTSEKGDRKIKLTSGMTVAADIITQEKNIISTLLEPIQNQLSRVLKDPSSY